MKFSFLISLVGWVVLFIAVAIIYFTLSKLGVFAKIEQTWGLVTTSKNHPTLQRLQMVQLIPGPWLHHVGGRGERDRDDSPRHSRRGYLQPAVNVLRRH